MLFGYFQVKIHLDVHVFHIHFSCPGPRTSQLKHILFAKISDKMDRTVKLRLFCEAFSILTKLCEQSFSGLFIPAVIITCKINAWCY
jgi:hypothetical protein